MNKHINRHRVEPKKKSNIVVPFGKNRIGRRKEVAVARLKPYKDRVAKVEKFLFDQKELNRKNRQLALDKRLALKNK